METEKTTTTNDTTTTSDGRGGEPLPLPPPFKENPPVVVAETRYQLPGTPGLAAQGPRPAAGSAEEASEAGWRWAELRCRVAPEAAELVQRRTRVGFLAWLREREDCCEYDPMNDDDCGWTEQAARTVFDLLDTAACLTSAALGRMDPPVALEVAKLLGAERRRLIDEDKAKG